MEKSFAGGIMDAMARTNQIESTNVELWGLYNVLRSSYLNVLYYGSRSVTWSQWNLWLQIGAALGSLGAVSGFMTAGSDLAKGHEGYWKFGSAVVGVISALSAVLPAIMGHAEKINRFERLHFTYCEIFQLAQRVIMDIRREGTIGSEQIGAAKLLGDLYSRLGQLDDPDYKDELKRKCEEKVRAKYPSDSLWYASVDGDQKPDTSPATTETLAT